MKVLRCITMERSGSTLPGVTYLSFYPVKYSNVYILPIFLPQVIDRYFSACNTIGNQNRIQQSDLVL